MEILAALTVLTLLGVVMIVDWLRTLRERRRAHAEAELDRKQAELRATILALAEQLGADAHEARKALIRESYLASGQAPPKL